MVDVFTSIDWESYLDDQLAIQHGCRTRSSRRPTCRRDAVGDRARARGVAPRVRRRDRGDAGASMAGDRRSAGPIGAVAARAGALIVPASLGIGWALLGALPLAAEPGRPRTVGLAAGPDGAVGRPRSGRVHPDGRGRRTWRSDGHCYSRPSSPRTSGFGEASGAERRADVGRPDQDRADRPRLRSSSGSSSGSWSRWSSALVVGVAAGSVDSVGAVAGSVVLSICGLV